MFRAAVLATTLALLAAALAGPGLANGGALAGACPGVPSDDGRFCRSVDVLVDGAARLCRNAGAPAAGCDAVDGDHVGEDAVLAYEAGWAHRAHGLQRALMDPLPLRLTLFPHTHNSFNAEAYAPTLSGLDPNQHYSLTDQLRMDLRGLELDLHWFPSPAQGGFGPILCHGNDDVVDHAGCTLERPFAAGLQELAAWLAEHPGEVLLLYFEDHLGGAEAHDAAAAQLEAALGPWLLRPAPGGCAAGRPLELSRADILARGAQALVVSSCGEGQAWRGLVFDYHANNIESVPFTPYPDCGGLSRATYDAKFVRFFEDRTWFGHMVTGAPQGLIDAATAADMVRCGANMPGFDLLAPGDGRLDALLWSWAREEPALAGPACAAQSERGRFVARDCGEALPYACFDGAWRVAGRGPWASGAAACGGTFAVPRTGYEQQRLLEARAAIAGPVWVGYADASGDGAWEA